jgi:hypothetical protein
MLYNPLLEKEFAFHDCSSSKAQNRKREANKKYMAKEKQQLQKAL